MSPAAGQWHILVCENKTCNSPKLEVLVKRENGKGLEKAWGGDTLTVTFKRCVAGGWALGLFHFYRAELVFWDLPVWVQFVDSQEVGGGFAEVEGNEYAAW